MPEVLGAWVQLGLAGGMLVMLGVALSKGWLWTGASVERVTEQLQLRLDDRDKVIEQLRATNEALDVRNDILAGQVQQLVEVGITSNAALSALPRVAREPA